MPWQVALGAVAIAGHRLRADRRHRSARAPDHGDSASLKHAIAAGIGLLIATIGLQWAGLIVGAPGTLVTLGDLHSRPVLLALVRPGADVRADGARECPARFCGAFWRRRVVGLPLGVVHYQGFVGAPPSIRPTLLQLDIVGALRRRR